MEPNYFACHHLIPPAKAEEEWKRIEPSRLQLLGNLVLERVLTLHK